MNADLSPAILVSTGRQPLDAARPSLLDRTALRWLLLAAAAAVVGLRALQLYQTSLIMDDAFILFRYARNLADGAGPVFNAGEKVEGYVTFLWVALLALGRRLGFDLPAVAAGLSFAATAVTLWVVHRLGARLLAGAGLGPPALALLAPLAFAAMATPARYIGSGMETSLFVLLVVGAFALYLEGARPLWVGLVLGLATMTRPDAVLCAGLLLSFEVAWGEGASGQRWRRAAVTAAAFAAVYLPYFAWRYLYYGWLLPNPFYAKVGGLSLGQAGRGLRFLGQAVRESSLELPLLLGAIGTAAAWKYRPARLLAGYVAVTAAYFVLVGGDFLFLLGPRFLMPALPLLLVLASAGVAAAGRAVPAPRLRQALAAVLAAVVIANAAFFSWPLTKRGDLRLISAIQQGWIELGHWFAAEVPPGTTIAAQPAGAIPYYSDLPTIDMFGLTDAHIAHRAMPVGVGSPGHEKFDIDYVLGRSPDYLVFMRLDPGGKPMLADWERSGPRVEAQYRLVALARGMPSARPLPWVIETGEVTPARLKEGYVVAIYRRRALEPPAAAEPAATGKAAAS